MISPDERTIPRGTLRNLGEDSETIGWTLVRADQQHEISFLPQAFVVPSGGCEGLF